MNVNMDNATAEQWNRYWAVMHAVQDARQATQDAERQMWADAATSRDTDAQRGR